MTSSVSDGPRTKRRCSALELDPDGQRESRVLYISYSSLVSATRSMLGPARRNFHILDQLSRFYDVSVLSLGSETDATLFARAFEGRVEASFAPSRRGSMRKYTTKVLRTLTSRCDFWPTHEPALRRLCSKLTRSETFDAEVLSNVLLRDLPLPAGVPIVGDTHNVEFDVHRRISATADSWFRRVYASMQWRATRRAELRAARQVDLLLATSERDGTMFQQEFDVRSVSVIPNGIDLAKFAYHPGSGETGVILFSGLMSYYPNQQGLRWFLDRVFPSVLQRVPGARLVAAGAAPPRWLMDRVGRNVHVTGHVPDMTPYLRSACVVIAPILIGGGTRVKILEAMAVGRPVVSTSIGAEGLRVRHAQSILLADGVESFAQQVVSALNDTALRNRLATAGRRYVVLNHDWDRIGEQLERVLSSRISLVPRASWRKSGCGKSRSLQ